MQAIDSQSFKVRDATSYDSVTEHFDHFTERLSSPLAEQIVALAGIESNHQILDVGTGTGIVAFEAAKKIGAGGKIRGIDLSEGMLAAASVKAKKLGLEDKIDFSKMDAENLELESGTFDRVVSLFALLHFPDPLAALKEIYRVMQPGGRLVVAVGSSPPLFSVSGIAHRIRVIPDMVRRSAGRQLVAPGFLDSMVEQSLPEKDAAEESHLASHSHNRTAGVAELVRTAGFKVLRTDWQGHQATLDTPEEFWEIQRTFSSIARKRLNGAADEKVEDLRQDFLRQCRTVQAKGGSLVYPFAAFYVAAQKPK